MRGGVYNLTTQMQCVHETGANQFVVCVYCVNLDGVSVCMQACVRQTLDNLIITFSTMRLDWRQWCFVLKPIGLNLSLHMCICFNPQGSQNDVFTCCFLGLLAMNHEVEIDHGSWQAC